MQAVWGYKKEWLEFTSVAGRVLLHPGELVAICETPGFGTEIMLHGGGAVRVQHSIQEVLKIIDDSREPFDLNPPPMDEATKKRLREEQLKQVEEQGEAMTRGAQKALKKDDRESWGKPGE
jgi:hypothetical protein